jgi:NarL family two-component system sensor histidine kinase LiaS
MSVMMNQLKIPKTTREAGNVKSAYGRMKDAFPCVQFQMWRAYVLATIAIVIVWVLVIGPRTMLGDIVNASAVPASVIAGIVAARWYGRKLSHRISDLTDSVDAWKSGDFTVTVADDSPDELGRLARSLNGMAGDLGRLIATRQRLATAEERNRMARNLHDTVKQQAFAAAMQLGAARTVLEDAGGPALVFVNNAEKLTNKVQEDLMTIIHDLHPDIVIAPDRPFAVLLRECAAEWSQTSGIAVDVQAPENLDFAAEDKHELLLIVQEALANVARHSQATIVRLSVRRNPEGGAVQVAISDNGRGFDPIFTPRGMGVYSMRDRAASLPDGHFGIETAVGDGVTVRVEFRPRGGKDGTSAR